MDVIQAYAWISTSSPNMLINWHFIVIQEWIKWKKNKNMEHPAGSLKKPIQDLVYTEISVFLIWQ